MSKNTNKSPDVSRDFEENHEDVIHRQCQELDAWRERYRELSKKYDEQVEGTSVQVKDCDAWREKYRALQKEKEALQERYESLQEESASMSTELSDLRKKLAGAEKACDEMAAEFKAANDEKGILLHSNELMKEELNRVREKLEQQSIMNKKHYTAWKELENRSLLARIVNKKIIV